MDGVESGRLVLLFCLEIPGGLRLKPDSGMLVYLLPKRAVSALVGSNFAEVDIAGEL